MRKLIKTADPAVVEEWKWCGTRVRSYDGIIIRTGESYKAVVKLTFAKGAALRDPARLYNAGRRQCSSRDRPTSGEDIDPPAFKTLIRQAFALSNSGKTKSRRKSRS